MNNKQLINGKFVFPENNCLFIALQTYKERFEKDTNSLIAQMILGTGEIIDHWYYRSDEWIEQLFKFPEDKIEPYQGPANKADFHAYGLFKIYAGAKHLPKKINFLLKYMELKGLNKILSSDL